MNPATISLLALLVVIVVSLTSRINVGILAIALAFPLGLYVAGWKADAVLALFPSSLFLTLVGVTLLFGIAHGNGSLEGLARRGVRLAGGRPALLPGLFFLLAGMISMAGPGAIAASALVAPLAMSAGLAAGVPPFLMALAVGNGANAGNLAPYSSVGLIVHAQMQKVGLPLHEWSIFAANFTAHLVVMVAAFLLFGGRKLGLAPHSGISTLLPSFTGRQRFTLAVLAVWIAAVVVLRVNPGLSAFAAAAVLVLARALDDQAAVASVPWPVLLMVSGVSVLVGVLEKTGGLDLFTGLLARIASPATANGAMAFVTGLISTYSSTSGVVYPAFLPTVPGLVEKLGGGNPLEIALSINVGAALVDVSPLSTIGALCIAALPAGGGDAKKLFRQMMLWGLAMTVVGAVFCQFAIYLFAKS